MSTTATAAPAAAPATSGAPAGSATGSSQGGGQGSNQGQESGSKSPGTGAGTPKAPTTPAKTDPAAAGNSKAELYDVKVNGKVVKMTLDELRQHASLGFASDDRFKEAAKLRKQAEGVIGKLRNPDQVMDALLDPALGYTKDQIRQKIEDWYNKEFIEPEQLSPSEKKLRDAEAKLKDYEKKDKDAQAQKEREQQESMTTQARETLQQQIIEAIDQHGLPKTNFTIRRLAYWMNRNNSHGFEATTEQLVNQVRGDIQTNLRDMIEASDGDVLIKLLGDGVIKKLRQYDLDQLRKLRGGGGQPPIEPAQEEQEKPNRPLTSAEVQARIRGLQRTGKY